MGKFLKPEKLISILKNNNLDVEKVNGTKFNILTDKRSVSEDKSINYIAKFIKN
jgi:2-polyprenyl-3-methyl-5-hydroxy-6-metoxy-1,4-benzoquinol methylase